MSPVRYCQAKPLGVMLQSHTTVTADRTANHRTTGLTGAGWQQIW
jgi:hypothetical protein